ncbi:MAG TPA: hypothetical protein VGC57_13205 [Cellulomonas sp.]
MTGVSGLGPWPGTEPLEAQQTVLGDLADLRDGIDGLPWLVRLPDRGPFDTLAAADGLGLLVDLPAELGVHGWQLADRPGRDATRLAAQQRERTDVLAIAGHGYAGPLVVPVCGPLTLAASVYLARGDRAVGDAGATAEIVDSLAAGAVQHLAAVRRAVPGAEPVLLVHEPMLAQVVAGVLPTFSGYARLRAVPGPVAAERLGRFVTLLRDGGAGTVVVHVGTGTGVLPAVRSAGVDAVGLEVAGLDERRWEQVAEVVEQGTALWAQVPRPATSQCAGPDVRGVADSVLVGWGRVGLERRRLRDVVLVAPGATAVAAGAGAVGGGVGVPPGGPTAAGGAAGPSSSDAAQARDVLATVARAASLVAERAED